MHTNRRRLLTAALASLALTAPLLATAIPAAAQPSASTDAALADSASGAAAGIRINEVESDGGTPGDWIELTNTGATSTDIGGYVLKDNDDSHVFRIPAGTVIGAGAYLAFDVDASGGFGLGKADSARLYASDATSLLDTYSWTAHAATTYGRCPDGVGDFVLTTSSTKGAANDCGTSTPEPTPSPTPTVSPTSPATQTVVINEVESNGGVPGDWAELFNTGGAAVDLSGWIVKDNDDSHVSVLPNGTTIAAHGYFVVEEAQLGFGLGKADSVRLYTPGAAQLVDSTSWTDHATTTSGRCPNGTGAFATTTTSTKGAANDCSGDGGTPPTNPGAAAPWPGGASISTLDTQGTFGGNLSGLDYVASGTAAPGVLWAVKNGPSTLYKLLWDGAKWTPDTANGWGAGKALRYADGTGDPDAEGVTVVDGAVYVSTERDNSKSGVSRPAVLRFDVGGSGTATTLAARQDWNLTTDFPGIAPNSGLEAVEWVPDSVLVAKGFVDQKTGAAYDPSLYPGHGSGLFFVGLEANGGIYAYTLSSSGSFTRIASIVSGFPGIMDLEFEAETNQLWAVCDDTCNGRTSTLEVGATGAFAITHTYERPAAMPNINNEGFTMAPDAQCVDGVKPVFWADDSDTDGHSIRGGTIRCTTKPTDPTDPTDPTTPTTPQPVPASALTDASRGGVTAPSSARAGDTITVNVGAVHAETTVDAWLYSTPVHLGTKTVSAAGAIAVTIPSDTVAGAHRLAAVGPDGTLIGWTDIRILAAAGGGGAEGAASDPTGLASTGSSADAVLPGAITLLLLGSILVIVRRKRSLVS